MLNQKQQIFEQLKKAQDILITFRKTWNGDSVASALALYLFLKKTGKKVDIAAEKFSQNEPMSFLPSHADIKSTIENVRKFIVSLDISGKKISQIKYNINNDALDFVVSVKNGSFNHEDVSSHTNNFKYDLIITLDTPDLESLGKIYDENTDLFYRIPVINIDHHANNEEFGQINYVELTAVSTTEILYSLFNNYAPDSLDENIATCLLAGMISKTRSFKTPNITPQALTIAAQLISAGADREKIVNNLYRSRPINVLKLWGRVLSRLSSALGEKMVWSSITHLDFVKTGSNETDLNEVIEELILNMPLVKTIIIFYEKIINGELATVCLLQTTTNIDAMMLLKEYEPQGTKIMAEVTIKKTIQASEKEVIALIQGKLQKMSI